MVGPVILTMSFPQIALINLCLPIQDCSVVLGHFIESYNDVNKLSIG